jgi:hypothetical protein
MRIKELLKEHRTPVEYLMILNEIVRNKKATNTVHYVLLANLIEHFRGTFNQPFNQMTNSEAPKDVLDSVKLLTADDLVFLAKFFINALESPDPGIYQDQLRDQALKTLDWISLVLRVQEGKETN